MARRGLAQAKFTLTLDPQSREPVHDQIVRKLRAAIILGQLRAGDRLPTLNAYQDALGVGRDTLHRAIKDLSDQGFVETNGKGGTTIVEPPEAAVDEYALELFDAPIELLKSSLGFSNSRIERLLPKLRIRVQSVLQQRAADRRERDEPAPQERRTARRRRT